MDRRRARLAVLAVALAPGTARAADAFEIQVYDGSANPAGVAGLELHVNGVAAGLTTSEPPEAPPNHQGHLTFEPSYGLTSFWELGAYLQTAYLPGSGYEYAGAKLRSKLVTTPSWSGRVRLGVNLEVSRVPAAYEAARWGLEVRPIFAFVWGRFELATNPIVGVAPTVGDVSFEPATQLLFAFPGVASFGLEHYADLGSLGGFASPNRQVHYLFEVMNLLAVRGFELNVGVGEGLTAASNAVVVKAIVGHAFEQTARH